MTAAHEITDIVGMLREPGSHGSANGVRQEVEKYGASTVLTHDGLIEITAPADVRGDGWKSGEVRTPRGGWAQILGSCPTPLIGALVDAYLNGAY